MSISTKVARVESSGPFLRPKAIDLFCGAGGMSLGFQQAGFEVVGSFDHDPIHVATYTGNFGPGTAHVLDLSCGAAKAITQLANIEPSEVDCVFGGPPCQGFSMEGHRSSDDPRNKLVQSFVKIVADLRPKYFVLENVEAILFKNNSVHMERLHRLANSNGYEIVTPIKALDASDFGVPQKRIRTFILGYRTGLPAPVYPVGSLRTVRVGAAIGDLPLIEEYEELFSSDVYQGKLGRPSSYVRELNRMFGRKPRTFITGCRRTVHSPKTIERFLMTANGTVEPVSRFYRLDSKGLARTIKAGTTKELGSFTAPRPIHPVYPRCITTREAARLHSYPDWFDFHKTTWHGFRQVGNSVPPRLASEVAHRILESLKEAETLGC